MATIGNGFRVAVLTTDTPHHRYFLRKFCHRISPAVEVALNLFETRPYPMARRRREHMRTHGFNPWRALALNPYIQPRAFSRQVDAFERARFFADGDDSLPKGLWSESVHSVNDDNSIALIAAAKPDVILVYGTGLVRPEVYELAPLGAVNAHGGKLPGDRGLDTNLWAAYEGRPDDMTATLHKVEARFDTGPVYASRAIGRQSGLSIYSLRYHAALACTEMFIELTDKLARETVVATPQGDAPSRYYSLMPWRLKRQTDRLLRIYAAGA